MERAPKEMPAHRSPIFYLDVGGEFMDAAKYRDEMFALTKMMEEKFGTR